MGCKQGSTWVTFITQTLCYREEKNPQKSYPTPPFFTLHLDHSSVSVANLGWQNACREKDRTKRKVEEENCISPKKLPLKSAGVMLFPRGGCCLPGLPGGVCEGQLWLLYVSWFRKVGDESYHHTHVHASAYSDGESCEEQSSSGGDVRQGEVSFVHRLSGLQERRCETKDVVSNTTSAGKRTNHFFGKKQQPQLQELFIISLALCRKQKPWAGPHWLRGSG